jgi:hypothetical protein
LRVTVGSAAAAIARSKTADEEAAGQKRKDGAEESLAVQGRVRHGNSRGLPGVLPGWVGTLFDEFLGRSCKYPRYGQSWYLGVDSKSYAKPGGASDRRQIHLYAAESVRQGSHFQDILRVEARSKRLRKKRMPCVW